MVYGTIFVIYTLWIISIQPEHFPHRSKVIRFIGDISFPVFILHALYINKVYILTGSILSTFLMKGSNLFVLISVINSILFVTLGASLLHFMIGNIINVLRRRVRTY